MKIEKVDIACIIVALFTLAAYLKIGQVAYLVATIILIVPVVFFAIRGRSPGEKKEISVQERKD